MKYIYIFVLYVIYILKKTIFNYKNLITIFYENASKELCKFVNL